MTSYEDASFELTTESGHSTRSTEHRSTSASSVSTIDDHDQDDPLLSTHTASVPPNPHSPLAAAALASGEWKVQHDHTTGKDYYYHAATKKTTWDLNKELAHTHSSDSSVREVSQPASTVESHPETIETSVDTGDGERKRAGHMAEANDEYNHLTGFVAFNSQGTPSIPRSSVAVSSKSPSKVTMSERLSVSVPRDDAKAEELSTTAVEQPTEANPSSVGGGLPPSKDVETSLLASITPSSAFSTLSQHLKKDIGSTPADAMAPTGILPRSSMKEPSPQPTSPAGIAATATLEIAAASPTSPSTFSSEAKPTIQVLTTEVPHTAGPISVASSSPVVEVTSGPLGTATAPRSQSYGLPVLPPSSFSTSHARSSPSAASPTSMYPARMSPGPVGGTRSDGGSGFASYPTHEHSSLPQTSAPMMVMNNNNSNTNDPKLLELREASEAVERLVKAFAYLRGHMGDDQPSTERSTAFASTAVEDRRTSPAHAMGNPSTVKATSLRPRAGTATRLPLARPVLSEDEAAAMQANAALLEETVMECVVELIQREGAQRQAAKDAAAPVAARLARRSQKEVVSADSYRIDAPSRRSCGDGMGRAVQIAAFFDEALASEDGDANTSLFHSIQDGLEKYLLRHVVDTAAGEVSSPSPGLAAYAVTAQFAWTLLVDLVSVCCDITEQCFGADGMPLNRMTTPILVKYDGERECEQIARNTIHCLPFELLQTAGGLGSDGLSSPVGKSVYRLDYWVTRPKMWVVIEALLNVLRRQMLLHARRNQYYPFRVDPEMAGKINIRSVVPPVAPMFVLQPMARTEEHMEEVEMNAHHSRLTGPSPRAKPHIRGRNTENDDDELHVSEGAMQTMSLMISEVSTNILTENPAMKELHDAKDYRELTSVVAETMQELLADASVNTAIQRRAADVFLKRRAEQLSSTDTRADRRERERLVVKKAEEEAERVVRRILQEMRVEEVRGAS